MKMPKFYVGKRKSVEEAVKNRIFSYPGYVYIRDEGYYAFIDKDGSLLTIKGDNKIQVLCVDKLPSITEGDVEVLYICDSIVYTFDGSDYHPAYKDHTAEIDAILERLTTVEETNVGLTNRVTSLETSVEGLMGNYTIKFIEF